MSLIARLLILKSKPGKRNDMMRVWEKYVRDFVVEDSDTSSFYYCFDKSDPDAIVVVQMTQAEAFAQKFVSQPWFADYQKETAELFAAPPEAREATVQWAKGALEPSAAVS